MSASTSIAAVTALLEVANIAMEAAIRGQKIAKLLQQAQAEKRDITAEELAALDADLNAAYDRAHAAI